MRTNRITRKATWVAMAACGALLFASLGCTSTPKGIPTGEWLGEGTYVDYEAIGQEKLINLIESRAKDNVYQTSLKISRQRMYDRDTLVFDIRSKRGELFNLDDNESHVRFALVPLKTLEHRAGLYAVVQWEYNPSKDRRVSEEEFNKQIQIASASCIRRDGATVLQINYITPSEDDPICFSDFFLFEGHRVRKSGHVVKKDATEKENKPAEEKLARILWVESLRKTK